MYEPIAGKDIICQQGSSIVFDSKERERERNSNRPEKRDEDGGWRVERKREKNKGKKKKQVNDMKKPHNSASE